MSILLCCFKLCALCGCRDYVIGKYAFYPPKTSYLFQKDMDAYLE